MPHDHSPDSVHNALSSDLTEMLDLDADVLHDYWTQVLDAVRHTAATGRRERLLDLGAGTGTAAIGLAQRFGDAQVVAVDVSDDMLDRLRLKALDLGLADQVRALRADLDVVWPFADPVDVVFASMSLHHFADPDRVLRQAFEALRPGGLLAVAELTEPLRFLPDNLGFGRPGFEQRCVELSAHALTNELPTLGSAWSPRIEAAGFDVVEDRAITIDVAAPPVPETIRYAELWFQQLQSGLGHDLAPDDQDTLSALLDAHGDHALRGRTDVHVRGVRTLTLAHRP